jgi:hypothetical protein
MTIAVTQSTNSGPIVVGGTRLPAENGVLEL